MQAARVTVGSVVPLIEAYREEEGSYRGLSASALGRFEPSLPSDIALGQISDDSYCVMATVGGQWAHLNGPGGRIERGGCSA